MINKLVIDALFRNSYQAARSVVPFDLLIQIGVSFRIPHIDQMNYKSLFAEINNCHCGFLLMQLYSYCYSIDDINLMLDYSDVLILLDILSEDAHTDQETNNIALLKAIDLIRNTPDKLPEIKEKKSSSRKPWSKKDIDFLKRNHLKMDIDELSMRLCRSKKSVSDKLYYLDLTTGKQNRWTDGHVSFLKVNYGSMPIEEIASKIGHPPASVSRKACDLRITQK